MDFTDNDTINEYQYSKKISKCKNCQSEVKYFKYLTSSIPLDAINEYNKLRQDSNGNCNICYSKIGCCHLISLTNQDNFRGNSNLIRIVRKIDKTAKFTKINKDCETVGCSTINKNQSTLADYKKMILSLLENWMKCECFTNTQNPINLVMTLKNILKTLQEQNIVSDNWINKFRKIFRYKIHIKEQLTTMYYSIKKEFTVPMFSIENKIKQSSDV
jgi:hypothetical protein